MKMPPRLTVVGDLERPDHSHLPAEAVCYCWGEYTPSKHIDGPAWNYSATNQLVSNFKKKLDRQHQQRQAEFDGSYHLTSRCSAACRSVYRLVRPCVPRFCRRS